MNTKSNSILKKEFIIQFFLLISLLILIAICSLKLYFRIDTTKQKAYSLSKYTLELLDNLNGTVTITWFKSNSIENFFPNLKYLADILYEYQNYAGEKFMFTKKDTSELSEEAIKKLGLIPRQVESSNSVAKSLYTLYSALMIEYNGETRIIPFIDDIDILEYDIARFIIDMQNIVSKKVTIIAPPNSLDSNYKYILPWLDYAGIKAEILQLPAQNIPENIPLLVIGSDYIDFSTVVAIDVFLQKNGRAIFFTSGNTVGVNGNWKATPKANDFLLDMLAHYGFYVNANLILDLSNFSLTMKSVDNSGAKTINYPFWIELLYDGTKKNHVLFSGIFSSYKHLQHFWPSSISYEENKNIIPLAFTSPNSFTMTERYDTDPFGNQLSLFATAEKQREPVVAERIQPTPIIVVADEYMISTAIDYTNSAVNIDFMINCIEHLLGLDDLTLLKNKQHSALPFKNFNTQEELQTRITVSRIISLIVLPLIILIMGGYVFFTERKKKWTLQKI